MIVCMLLISVLSLFMFEIRYAENIFFVCAIYSAYMQHKYASVYGLAKIHLIRRRERETDGRESKLFARNNKSKHSAYVLACWCESVFVYVLLGCGA